MLKIGFCHFGLDKPMINAWFGGMYRSFFKALEEQGCGVSYSDTHPDKSVDVLVVPMGGGQDKTSVKSMLQFNGPVVLNIGAAAYWFRKGLLKRWQERILFLYGTDCSGYSANMAKQIGLPYHNMAFGSNPAIMRPLDLPKQYDIVFVGNADSGVGRHKYIESLLKEFERERMLFLGSGWERHGYPFQTVAWGDLLNIIYNLSHVCLNISNDEQKEAGTVSRLDANNRLFDLAMAGCFQISNAPQLVRHYFNEAEVVAIDSPAEWGRTIRHYLDNVDEMQAYKLAARKRALAEHDWRNRAEAFKNEIEAYLPGKKAGSDYGSGLTKVSRFKDAFI